MCKPNQRKCTAYLVVPGSWAWIGGSICRSVQSNAKLTLMALCWALVCTWSVTLIVASVTQCLSGRAWLWAMLLSKTAARSIGWRHGRKCVSLCLGARFLTLLSQQVEPVKLRWQIWWLHMTDIVSLQPEVWRKHPERLVAAPNRLPWRHAWTRLSYITCCVPCRRQSPLTNYSAIQKSRQRTHPCLSAAGLSSKSNLSTATSTHEKTEGEWDLNRHLRHCWSCRSAWGKPVCGRKIGRSSWVHPSSH